MARIPTLQRAEVTPDLQLLYDQVESVFGVVPNLLKTAAHAPEAAGPLVMLLGALRSGGRVDQRSKELAILMASLQNGCHY